ncbi:hypothetical protein [Thermoanaerobacterium sp. DL9XJH110]|uniref:hypothetical protein n=1 Tax=Thermoanaerobacterium sp. DL9XJH110 TaxID=3386643 RepID=UPI003BB5BED6
MNSWVEFAPVKNKSMIFNLAEKLMQIKPVRLESVPEGWKLSILVGKEKKDGEKMGQLV